MNAKFPIRWVPLNCKEKTYVGMSRCPGKFSEKQGSTEVLWSDLKSLKEQEINVIVSLLTTREIESLAIGDFKKNLAHFGFIHHMEPIKDFSVPSANRRKNIIYLVKMISKHLIDNKNILIHCNAGLGRSGIIVALLVKFYGVSEDSVSYLRKFCPGAVETKEQEAFIRNFTFPED